MKQYSLLELCDCIDDALNIELDAAYWVRAEIASLTARGHCYMELVEKAKSPEDRTLRIRRNAFYEKNGFFYYNYHNCFYLHISAFLLLFHTKRRFGIYRG